MVTKRLEGILGAVGSDCSGVTCVKGGGGVRGVQNLVPLFVTFFCGLIEFL